MNLLTTIDELVLPTGTIRRAFARIALSRRWRDQRRIDDDTERRDQSDETV